MLEDLISAASSRLNAALIFFWSYWTARCLVLALMPELYEFKDARPRYTSGAELGFATRFKTYPLRELRHLTSCG